MSRPKRTDTVVKFPIGRVVREHRIGIILAATPKAEAIEQALRSVRDAIRTLQRQRATLELLAWRGREKETPEQHAALVKRSMAHIYAWQDEDAAEHGRNESDDGGSAA